MRTDTQGIRPQDRRLSYLFSLKNCCNGYMCHWRRLDLALCHMIFDKSVFLIALRCSLSSRRPFAFLIADREVFLCFTDLPKCFSTFTKLIIWSEFLFSYWLSVVIPKGAGLLVVYFLVVCFYLTIIDTQKLVHSRRPCDLKSSFLD